MSTDLYTRHPPARLLKWSLLLIALAAGLLVMLGLIFGGALLVESVI